MDNVLYVPDLFMLTGYHCVAPTTRVLLILHNKNSERIGTQIFQIKVHANLQHKIHQPSIQITKRNCYLSVPLTLSFIFCCYSYIYFRFIISSGLSIHLTTVFAPPNPNVGLRLFEEVLYRVLNMNSWNCSGWLCISNYSKKILAECKVIEKDEIICCHIKCCIQLLQN